MLEWVLAMVVQVLPSRVSHFLDNNGFRRYLSNTGWMFFGQAFTFLVAFFMGVYIARYLGPGNFGLMNYAVSFAGLFGFLASFGVDGVLGRELVAHPEKHDEYLSAGFWLKMIGGVMAVVVINLFSLVINHDSLTRMLVFMYSFTFLLQSLSVISIYFQSKVVSRNTVLIQIVATVISAAVKLYLIYRDYSVVWFMAVYVLDGLIIGLGLLIVYYGHRHRFFSLTVPYGVCRSLFKDSLPLMFTIVFTTLYAKIDQVLLKHLVGASAVGVYSVAVKLSEIWYVIPAVLCASLFPAIINARIANREIYIRRLRHLYVLVGSLALVVAIPIFVAAPLLLALLYGPEYSGAAGVLQIYIWSGVPIFFMAVTSQYLLAENYTTVYLFITIIGAVINIALNVLLIPRYGIHGSAVATVISYSAVPLSLLFFTQVRQQLRTLFTQT